MKNIIDSILNASKMPEILVFVKDKILTSKISVDITDHYDSIEEYLTVIREFYNFYIKLEQIKGNWDVGRKYMYMSDIELLEDVMQNYTGIIIDVRMTVINYPIKCKKYIFTPKHPKKGKGYFRPF